MLIAYLGGLCCLGIAQPMNVLFITVDDLNVDIGCYGHPVVKTPNIDRFRERGMVFERAYAQYPLCNPSRNSFLTGLYPGTSGCLSNAQNIRKAVPDVVTLPQLFKNSGYRAISSGKVFHQEDPDSWSQISDLRNGGVLPMGLEPKCYHPPMEDEKQTMGKGGLLTQDPSFWFVWRSVTENENLLVDDRTTRATCNWIDELAKSGESFFLAVGFSRPHHPLFAPKRFFDMYPLDSLTLPRPPFDASPVPDYVFYAPFKAAFDTMTEQQKLKTMRAYYACTSYMDEQVGLVLDYFESKGLMENTVIVLLGDHGYLLGEKNYWNKGVLFERACHAPLIIATPGMENAGGSCEHIVEFVDIFPTLAELCGLHSPEGLDGDSLVPLLKDPGGDWKDIAYTYCNSDRSVRDNRYRYIEYKRGGCALYDHGKDSGEHYNQAGNPEYETVVKRMKNLIRDMPEPTPRKNMKP